MPELHHREPCAQCPWLRRSAPGWLGADTPEGFLATAQAEHEMPCHIHIDYEDRDWRVTQLPDAPLCAGALQFFNNSCKLPRDPKLAAACREVGKNERVFQFPHEFLEYHTT